MLYVKGATQVETSPIVSGKVSTGREDTMLSNNKLLLEGDVMAKLLSRKLLVAAMCYSIVLLAGLDLATFPTEVMSIATAGLVAFIGGQAAIDYKNGS